MEKVVFLLIVSISCLYAQTVEIEPFLTGTTDAKEPNFQYHASIRVKSLDNVRFGDGHICNGALIQGNAVITSSQCTENRTAEDLQVVLGSSSVYARQPNKTSIHEVKSIHTRPIGEFAMLMVD
jgi:hypothetical protein